MLVRDLVAIDSPQASIHAYDDVCGVSTSTTDTQVTQVLMGVGRRGFLLNKFIPAHDSKP
jgi:hypothetical protein